MPLRARKQKNFGPANINMKKSGLDSLFKKKGTRVSVTPSVMRKATRGRKATGNGERKPIGAGIRIFLGAFGGIAFCLSFCLGIMGGFTRRNVILMGVSCAFIAPVAISLLKSRRAKKQKSEKKRSIDKFIPAKLGAMELSGKRMDVDVAGIGYAELKLGTLRIGDRVDIIPEPENPNDHKALRLSVRGAHLGYVYRGAEQDMLVEWNRKGLKTRAYISGVDAQAGKAQICLAFYRPSKYEAFLKSDARSRVFRLTHDNSDEMKIAVDSCYCGEEILADIDYAKDRHMCYANGPIGYLPPAALSFIDTLDDYLIFVEDKELLATWKTVAKVRIFEATL